MSDGIKVVHHYFAGAEGVDAAKMRAAAEKSVKEGKHSVVHNHTYRDTTCTEECKEYGGDDEAE